AASQKDLLDTIWHATRGFIVKEFLLESKLVPVPYLSNADDFGLFSENVSQKIKHSMSGACYHVIGHVSQVIELEKTDLDRLLNSAKQHTEDVGCQSEKWEKDIDLGPQSVHLTVEGLHKFLIPLNLSEGDLFLKQNIPDLVGAKSVYIITDVMMASRF
ncbi:DNA-3-methyladenine glycosylase, partial [Daphnia magna]